MCTVTFLPVSDTEFILTSNRDEQRNRQTLAPKKYNENGVLMLFPKDVNAGGTWIGTSNKKRLACVLNGGFVKHQRKASYTKSRGLIAKALLKTDNLHAFINALILDGVEPFTMVIVDWSTNQHLLYELVWDEQIKHFTQLSNKPRIWSSSTLYESDSKNWRKQLFKDWLGEFPMTQKNILQFHHSEQGDKAQSILMKRPYVETVSITSVQKNSEKLVMHYEDLVEKRADVITF